MNEILKLLVAALAGVVSFILIIRKKAPECPT
jgi:hypothetical protein